MKIRIEFGFSDGTENVNWYRDIADFPKLLRYQGDVYEFVMYAPTGYGHPADYIFNFSKTKYYKARWEDIPVFRDMFGYPSWDSSCKCGAKHDKGNPNYHYPFCDKYKKKD